MKNKDSRLSTKDEQAPQQTSDTSKKSPFKLSIALPYINLLVILALITAVGFAGYFAWQKFEQQQQFVQNQQQQIEQLLSQQENVTSKVEKQLNQNNINQAKELKILHETIAAFLKQNKHARRDWLINETEYLIKLANHRLILANDSTTAIQALLAADNRLLQIGNPKFIPLRNALAIDVQKLRAISTVDIVGISAQLSALQLQTESLPLLTPDPKTIKQRHEEPSNISEINSWKELPTAVWQDLLTLFRIQKHNEVIKPLLLPEHRFFLIQNLKLQLEQARLAVLQQNSVLFKERTNQTILWIKKYYDSQHSLTQSVLNTLQTISDINIHVDLPDITDSLNKLALLHGKKPTVKKQKKIIKKNKPLKQKSNKNLKGKEPASSKTPKNKIEIKKSEKSAVKI